MEFEDTDWALDVPLAGLVDVIDDGCMFEVAFWEVCRCWEVLEPVVMLGTVMEV